MALTIYNSLSRQKEIFKPIHAGKIGLYVCGNTVYDYMHIGHARAAIAFDVIVRFLRSQNWEVKFVRNITDVDDKILNRAAQNGETPAELVERMIAAQREDEQRLGMMQVDVEPRVTHSIDEIFDIVQRLVDNHYAYAAANGDVYFRVKRFDGYGKLSGKNPDELLAGARIEVGEAKEDPRDFALWKAAPEDQPGWQSPWGWGRPGWHIECSAMACTHLGETFDIHGGGLDLQFPHHENEIAQSEAASGKPFAHYWMHGGMVRVNNEKMSKSLGNFFTVRDVLETTNSEVLRFFLISSHYRSPINYSAEALKEARAGLERLYTALRPYADVAPALMESLQSSDHLKRFVEVMNDDFNTREAMAVLFDLARIINTSDTETAAQKAAELKALGGIFGLLQQQPDTFLQSAGGAQQGDQISAEQVEALIEARLQARKDKNFARADEIRQQLLEQGVVLEDSREGTSWRRN